MHIGRRIQVMGLYPLGTRKKKGESQDTDSFLK